MDGRKLALFIMLVSATAAALYQTPMIQAIGRGQHTFERRKQYHILTEANE